MKLKHKVLSFILAALFLVSAFSTAIVLNVSAAPASLDRAGIQQYYVKSIGAKTPQGKLDTMTLGLSKYGYELYYDAVSGEVAVKETANPNNILFSNPYDVSSANAKGGSDGKTTSVKEELLSQVIVRYSDITTNQAVDMYSFEWAAMKNQISVSKIRNGIRVEYTIGTESTRKLMPRQLPATHYEEMILGPIQAAQQEGKLSAKEEFNFLQFQTYYIEKNLDKVRTDAERAQMLKDYPITEEYPIYVLDASDGEKSQNMIETFIKEWTEYSFEQMDEDHEATGYVAEDEELPVFKMALEYTLTEEGMTARMSCNGLQYNMAKYRLENISILPYMGAGNSKNPGYNFFPDGSGSLFDFEMLRTKAASVSGNIYGMDYALHDISTFNMTYQKVIRMPVYGTVATEVIHTYTDKDTGEEISVSDTVTPLETLLKDYTREQIKTKTYRRGYVAIIDGGESLGKLITMHEGSRSEYATVKNEFNPKPKDKYDIADSISVTSSSEWTVVSDRKYTGSIRIHYRFLTDGDALSQETKNLGKDYRYYDASWLGMAEAYRDYLISGKVLTKLTDEDLDSNIPLYLEVFGALKTQKTVMTFPVMVMTPLTTFENILTMYQELSSSGLTTVNFKMTGFANGGMYSTMPYKLKWERAVGGKSGFEDLVAAAKKVKEENADATFGIYPDFDFAYSSVNKSFDGLNLKKDAIRTIDNRYTSKRIYSATQQKYVSFFQLAISPSRYSKFYTKLIENYKQYDLNTMSVSTLGNALNSDFDEDAPFNREDGKEFTVKALQNMKAEGYHLMTDGGNSYTWAYVDHIINADLDSSRYTQSSASVPFLGTVLHGYIQFAGAAFNMEGDTNYAILKAVENGAGMYFILSYQNTSILKEDPYLSQYYSINYDIWKEDLVTYYHRLNDLLRDVQSKVIIGHEFLNYSDQTQTVRLPDLDELSRRISEQLAKAELEAKQAIENEEIAKDAKLANAMVAIRTAQKRIDAYIELMRAQNEDVKSAYNTLKSSVNAILYTEDVDEPIPGDAINKFKASVINALSAYSKLTYYSDQIQSIYDSLDGEVQILKDALDGTDRAFLYTDAQAAAATVKIPTERQTLLDEYKAFTEQPEATGFDTVVNGMYDDVLAKLAETETVYDAFTFAELQAAGIYQPPQEATGTQTVAEDDDFSSDRVVNNRVVAVTYGDLDGDRNKTAYKTFLLNYNNYVVRTVYDNVEYTIPAYGCVVIYH